LDKKNKYLDFVTARCYIRKFNFKNRDEFRKHLKINLVSNIPSNPNYFYKNEWISMSDWLGKKLKSNKNLKKLNYIDSVKKVKNIITNDINTKSKWIKFYEKNIIYFNDVPKNPNIVYKNTGWVSWSDWFGFKSKSDSSKINLDELLSIIKENNIDTREKYYKITKILYIPTNPLSKFNLNKWSDILLPKIKKADKKFLNYDDAKKIINKFNIRSQSEWYKLCKLGKIPKNIPKTPNKLYNDWVSWNEWLGHKTTTHKKFLPYIKAIDYIKNLGLTSLNEYYDFVVNNSIDFLPLNPIIYYKGNYKTSDDFLNFKKRIPYGEKKIIEFLKNKKIIFLHQHSFDDCIHIKKLIFDFYLPCEKICIEFDGRQHFEPIEYFGGLDAFNSLKIRDGIKNDYCENKGYKIIRISYEDINIIDSILSKNINKSQLM
jgi:very-short-patch-repair endonuclease